MIRLDTVLRVRLFGLKVTLLIGGIIIWFVGLRMNYRPAMLAAIGLVVIAFLLRFVKAPPPNVPNGPIT